MANIDSKPIGADELTGLFQALAPFHEIFVAVSGGADSMALMHLLAAWRSMAAQSRPAVSVLTVNHGLRAEAAAEADMVVAEARALGLSATSLIWRGVKPQSGVQEAAREARYELMLGHIRERGADPGTAALVTAHHRDDMAETLLMRLARGAGIDGLASIPARRYLGEVAVLRPLLDIPKSRLEATLVAAGARWIEDPSNQNRDFERVQLRAAKAEQAALGLSGAALSLTARRMARARRALEDATTDWLAPRLQQPLLARSGVFVWRRGREKAAGAIVAEVADEIAIRSLMRLLPAIGGIEPPPRLLRVERLWDDLQRCDFAGATLGNCVIRPGDEGEIFIYREPERGNLPDIGTGSGQVLIWDNRFEVSIGEVDHKNLRVRALSRKDFDAFGIDARALELPYPVDALRASPVFTDIDGLLAIPALKMHRNGPQAWAEARLACRFMVERAMGQFPSTSLSLSV